MLVRISDIRIIYVFEGIDDDEEYAHAVGGKRAKSEQGVHIEHAILDEHAVCVLVGSESEINYGESGQQEHEYEVHAEYAPGVGKEHDGAIKVEVG